MAWRLFCEVYRGHHHQGWLLQKVLGFSQDDNDSDLVTLWAVVRKLDLVGEPSQHKFIELAGPHFHEGRHQELVDPKSAAASRKDVSDNDV